MYAFSCFFARLLGLALLLYAQLGMAQSCAPEALTAKYWQYRENFNKHFVMNDRKPEGCVGNGITKIEGDFSQLSCGTELLHGFGLPATSIIMTPNGGDWTGMGDRNVTGGAFFNPNCANAGPSPGTSWNPPGSPNFDPTAEPTEDHHNVLEYGSETPHQIGWYLVTLATEYALLGQNGQLEEQQRTLEDLFLALQAYRRLDITANCLVKDRYDEITAGFEVENCDIWVGNHHYTEDACLCAEKYHNGQCGGLIADAKWHFDIPCKTNCPWSPNLSGFSGFYIREDAVQEQEGLHDASEDRWNVDLVGNAFAMSQSPPCEPNFSPTCYNEKHTNFLSHDQTFSILMGLAMVKRYIPPNATVITCDGTAYNPFNIVQEIANGMVKLPQNTTRHVFWPGSSDDDCCYKAVKFGECAGGNLQWTYAGIEYMFNYINEGDDDHNVGAFDRLKWGKRLGREAFFATAMSIGFDIGSYGSNHAKQRIINTCMDDKMEILLLMNDLLHPLPPNIMDDEDQIELKNRFKQMLCDAPCGGVCFKPIGYDNHDASWPEFECANTPNWIGQRWEGYGYPPPNQAAWEERQPRQYNGLDFMALYNTYMLNFPEEQTLYYNPDRPEPTSTGHLLGEEKIEGPTILCPGQMGNYELKQSYTPSTLTSIVWESSSNMTLSSTSTNPTTATILSVQTPSFIGATFKEEREIPQYENGLRVMIHNQNGSSTIDPVTDVCELKYNKPIVTRLIDYRIQDNSQPCFNLFKVEAIPFGSYLDFDILPESEFSWKALNLSNQMSTTGIGKIFDFWNIIQPFEPCSGIEITLEVSACGQQIIRTAVIDCTPCGDVANRSIIITPNPGNDQISVRVMQDGSQDFTTSDPNGVRLRMYPSNGGTTTLLDSYLYSNGQMFNTANIPNGLYTVVVTASDLPPLQANIAIIH